MLLVTGNQKLFIKLMKAYWSSADSSWHDWREFNKDWYQTDNYKEFKTKAISTLNSEFSGEELFVLKDPSNLSNDSILA